MGQVGAWPTTPEGNSAAFAGSLPAKMMYLPKSQHVQPAIVAIREKKSLSRDTRQALRSSFIPAVLHSDRSSSSWKVSETKYAVAVFPHENEPCSKGYRDDSSELKYTTCIAFMVSSSFVFLHPSYHVKIPGVNATCGCILSNFSGFQNNPLPVYCKVSVYYSERIKSLRIKLIHYNRCTRTHKKLPRSRLV